MSSTSLLIFIILSAVVGAILMFGFTFAITRNIESSIDVGYYGIILGAAFGYFLAQLIVVVKPSLTNDMVSSSTDAHVEQTVSQNSISVDELRSMTVEEIQELIEDDPVMEEKKDYVTVDELKNMSMEEIQDLLTALHT